MRVSQLAGITHRQPHWLTRFINRYLLPANARKTSNICREDIFRYSFRVASSKSGSSSRRSKSTAARGPAYTNRSRRSYTTSHSTRIVLLFYHPKYQLSGLTSVAIPILPDNDDTYHREPSRWRDNYVKLEQHRFCCRLCG